MIGRSFAAQRRLLAIIALSIILWGLCCTCALADEIAILDVVGLPKEVVQGDQFDVSIELAGVEGLYGFDLRFLYDTKVLQAVDQDPAKEGAQMAAGDLLSPDFVVTNVADNQAGTAWLAMTHLNPREPVTGTGTALIVTFEAASDGSPSLQIVGATLAKRDGERQYVRLADPAMGQLADSQPTATIEPTAAPTDAPTAVPTTAPTDAPTAVPTEAPTTMPTVVGAFDATSGGIWRGVLIGAMALAAIVTIIVIVLKRR